MIFTSPGFEKKENETYSFVLQKMLIKALYSGVKERVHLKCLKKKKNHIQKERYGQNLTRKLVCRLWYMLKNERSG